MIFFLILTELRSYNNKDKYENNTTTSIYYTDSKEGGAHREIYIAVSTEMSTDGAGISKFKENLSNTLQS